MCATARKVSVASLASRHRPASRQACVWALLEHHQFCSLKMERSTEVVFFAIKNNVVVHIEEEIKFN